MTTTINASPTNGLVQTADGSGVLKVQSNGVTTNALAWVNFNGTGTVAIRSSYNVSSITDNGTGNYTVNFAAALSDANYSAQVTNSFVQNASVPATSDFATTSLRVRCYNVNDTIEDASVVSVAIFGN